MPSELPPEIRHELTRLRAIMYEPSSVWLTTWAGSERWLTDQYVMLDITGSYAITPCGNCRSGRICGACPPELGDGSYKLVASKGFEAKELGWQPDLDVYFARMDELADWHPVTPSEWSVAEHPGKAMLWIAQPGDYPFPCLLGESTWTAIKRNHPGVLVEYSEETNVFRFTDERVFCFAAGIRIPTGQANVASAIASAADTTSNGSDDE